MKKTLYLIGLGVAALSASASAATLHLMPEITGGRMSLLVLNQMANEGKAWPLLEGSGTIYGMFVVESLSETRSEFFADGSARSIEFTLTLTRVDESLTAMFGDLQQQADGLLNKASAATQGVLS